MPPPIRTTFRAFPDQLSRKEWYRKIYAGKGIQRWQRRVTWKAILADDRILIYNEDFIIKNIQSYGNPGVFTISEVNAEKKKQADEKATKKPESIGRCCSRCR